MKGRKITPVRTYSFMVHMYNVYPYSFRSYPTLDVYQHKISGFRSYPTLNVYQHKISGFRSYPTFNVYQHKISAYTEILNLKIPQILWINQQQNVTICLRFPFKKD